MLSSALAYALAHRTAHLEALRDWLRIPSVSTLPEHAGDVRRAGQWAVDRLRAMGMSRVEMVDTAGHPIVYAEWLGAPAPTLLIYGHFDVQPVDPIDEWARPPFEPRLEGETLFGRGASDDKGQAFAVLAALESFLKSSGRLPVNIKVLLEGEEEITSPHLAPYLRDHIAQLRADAILIADQDMIDPMHPVVMYGVRETCMSRSKSEARPPTCTPAPTAVRWTTPSTCWFACWRACRTGQRAASSSPASTTPSSL
jgi:acetylornithine deacetylase/succinyl-diaminopimelate desuccinylase-like protein